MEWGVPKGSVRLTLLFLICIDVICNYSTTLYAVYDINMLKIIASSVNKLQKQIHPELIFHINGKNPIKSHVYIFRHPDKLINYDLKNKY